MWFSIRYIFLYLAVTPATVGTAESSIDSEFVTDWLLLYNYLSETASNAVMPITTARVTPTLLTTVTTTTESFSNGKYVYH